MTCDCRTSKAHYTDQVSHEASLLAEDSSSSDQIQKQGVSDGEVCISLILPCGYFLDFFSNRAHVLWNY